jgi:hypothetical protein
VGGGPNNQQPNAKVAKVSQKAQKSQKKILISSLSSFASFAEPLRPLRPEVRFQQRISARFSPNARWRESC